MFWILVSEHDGSAVPRSVYSTPPEPRFLNGVLLLETELGASKVNSAASGDAEAVCAGAAGGDCAGVGASVLGKTVRTY